MGSRNLACNEATAPSTYMYHLRIPVEHRGALSTLGKCIRACFSQHRQLWRVTHHKLCNRNKLCNWTTPHNIDAVCRGATIAPCQKKALCSSNNLVLIKNSTLRFNKLKYLSFLFKWPNLTNQKHKVLKRERRLKVYSGTRTTHYVRLC